MRDPGMGLVSDSLVNVTQSADSVAAHHAVVAHVNDIVAVNSGYRRFYLVRIVRVIRSFIGRQNSTILSTIIPNTDHAV